MVEMSAALSSALVQPGAALAAMPATASGDGAPIADFSALLAGAALAVDGPKPTAGLAILADMPEPTTPDIIPPAPPAPGKDGTSGKPTGKTLPPGKLPPTRDVAGSAKAPRHPRSDAMPGDEEAGQDVPTGQDHPSPSASVQQAEPTPSSQPTAVAQPAIESGDLQSNQPTPSKDPAPSRQPKPERSAVMDVSATAPLPKAPAMTAGPETRQPEVLSREPVTSQTLAPTPTKEKVRVDQPLEPDAKPAPRSAPVPTQVDGSVAAFAPAQTPVSSAAIASGPTSPADQTSARQGSTGEAATMPARREMRHTAESPNQATKPDASNATAPTTAKSAATDQPAPIRVNLSTPVAAATDGNALSATMREAVRPIIASESIVPAKVALLTAPLPSIALSAPALSISDPAATPMVSTLSVIAPAYATTTASAPQASAPVMPIPAPEQSPVASTALLTATPLVDAASLPLAAATLSQPIATAPSAQPMVAAPIVAAPIVAPAPTLAPQTVSLTQPMMVAVSEPAAHKSATAQSISAVEASIAFAQPDAFVSVVAADVRATPLPAPSPFAAPVSTTPTQDIAALVDRITEARAAAAPDTVRAALVHEEFGSVSLNFRSEASHIHVTLGSADPGFAPAVQAAAAASLGQRDQADDSTRREAPAPQSSAPAQDGATRNDGAQQQASRDRPHTGERHLPRAPSARRAPNTPDTAATPQHRSGIFA